MTCRIVFADIRFRLHYDTRGYTLPTAMHEYLSEQLLRHDERGPLVKAS
jgi:hypothetical protein